MKRRPASAISTLLKGGRLIDPLHNVDDVVDVLIVNGRIAKIGPAPIVPDVVLDCSGKIVCPGFIDLHVALRDPGFEEDETTFSGTAAALAGGFTTIAALPDTDPVVDNRASAEYVILQAARAGNCHVVPLGSVTRNCGGAELADIGQLVDCGAVAFTDAKRPIQSAEILRRALEYARMFGKPIFTNPQDTTLTAGGVMHEGYYSTLLGLRGMPAAAEELMVNRDIALASLTKGHVHLMSISTAGSVDAIRRAQGHAVHVTADVTPHHLLLTDAEMESYQSRYKVTPPLRTPRHVAACIAGLKDGTICAISADHQPYAAEKIEREIDQVPFGVVGLETLLAVCVKALVEPGHLTWLELISKLTAGPAKVLKLNAGQLGEGAVADITILDPTAKWTVDPARFVSRGKSTPFAGAELTGRIEQVLVEGEVRFVREGL